MSELFKALNQETVRTENGMRTLASSNSALVDLFFKWGGSRGKFKTEIIPELAKSISEDVDSTIRLLLWGRDVRGGAGERLLFREAIKYIVDHEYLTEDEVHSLIKKIPEVGRWDDVLVFAYTKYESFVFDMIKENIDSGNKLAAKWMPRKGALAAHMRNHYGMTPKQYRKWLVSNTEVVEQQMCAKEWDKINFSQVPSIASARYQAAFYRNAEKQYTEYRQKLMSGDKSVKINASSIFPHDVIMGLRNGDAAVASEQWKALPNYMKNSENAGILPVVDVSGSMFCQIGPKSNVYCVDVAIALGIYLSERNEGIFKDQFITFSSKPEIVELKGDLKARYHQLKSAKWGYSTNLEKTFDVVLNAAVKHNVKPENMPKMILILSDMQFNEAVADRNAMEMIEFKYAEAGYERPKLVFWNLRTSHGVPVEFDKQGTALVSGFSPSLMKTILNGENFTPAAIVAETIYSPRYNWK